ncbi:MAG: hypothetical protein MZV65_42535 [Chromatiales bacterium]|nr:hypothetical protein [Chromatiales bacterium]
MQRTTEHQTLVEMRAKLEQLQHKLDEKMEHAVADVQLFANAALLHQYLLSSNESERYTLLQPPLLRQFAGYHEAHPTYQEIRVLTPDGEEDAALCAARSRQCAGERGAHVLFPGVAQDPGRLQRLLPQPGQR